MADIDVEAVLKKLTLAEKVELLAGELYILHNLYFLLPLHYPINNRRLLVEIFYSEWPNG
jgi:hypothetical protein